MNDLLGTKLHFPRFNSKNLIKYLVVSICAYALYLRIVKLSHHTLWIDEIYLFKLMTGSFVKFINSLPYTETCGYMAGDQILIYPFYKIFGANKWGLAIPFICITILGFYFLYLICSKYFKTISGYVIAFSVMCMNATLIWHATEIRAYAILPTLSLATFYFSQTFIDRFRDLTVRKKSFFIVFFLVVIWFHAFGILIFTSIMAFSLLSRFQDKEFRIIFKDVLKALLVVLCIALPFWFYCCFIIKVPGYNGDASTFHYIPNPLNNIIGFLKGIFGNLVGYKKFYFLLIGVVFPFIPIYKERWQQALFLILTIFFPILIILLADIRNSYWFIQRQFIWVMPLFAFYLGWVWDSFFQQVRNIFLKEGISTVVPINKT